nr:hypothetical protein [Tanacetum cinerariifolium]
MVGTENLLPQQPPQAHTSSTDGNKCTEKVPTEQRVPSKRQCITSLGFLSDDRSTTEATSMNNVSPVDVYSLSGCVPDAEIPNNLASLLKCSYCFRATIDDGATQTSPTYFSPQAHTLTRDSNEVVNELTDKDLYQLSPHLY